jgi:hypothetical protein
MTFFDIWGTRYVWPGSCVAHRVPLLHAGEAIATHKAGGFTGTIVLEGLAAHLAQYRRPSVSKLG